ncbi:uncharacterized protein LOC128681471 [Plodia interpunctella]|uniref:uncharacterized protein LOC128681471 n=1 Tax=Plodia interpunctella TaxID=58824 RepID=UPI002367AA5E|nr:uncharacterized protein LOC128681471 [Plodia interpunctella]
MDGFMNGSELFSQDIFSKFDENYKVENATKLNSNVMSQNEDGIEASAAKTHENTQNAPKIVPRFGKKKKMEAKKPQVLKPKKFVPPTKLTENQAKSNVVIEKSQKIAQKITNNSLNSKTIKQTDINKSNQEADLTYCSRNNQHLSQTSQNKLCADINNLYQDLIQDNTQIEPIHDYFLQPTPKIVENCDEIMNPINYNDFQIGNIDQYLPKFDADTQLIKLKRNKKFKTDIGDIIFGSLNVLNDEEINQDLSDRSSLNLSQSQNESFCSVKSLKKTYKDLDMKSFEVSSKANLAKGNTEVMAHKIREGDDFFNLFRNNTIKNIGQPVAMSIETDDMGFKVKYAEYMKKNMIEKEEFGGAKDVYFRILQMYPEENKNLFKKMM